MPWRYVIALLFLGFFLCHLWLLLPADVWITPFHWRKDISLTVQEFADYAGTRIMFCIFAGILSTHYQQMKPVFAAYCCYLLEYLVNYNEPVAYFNAWPRVPVSVTTALGVMLLFLTLKAWSNGLDSTKI